MFARWGEITYRFRKVLPLVVLILIGLLYGIAGTQLTSRLDTEGWDDPGSSSARAAQIEKSTYGRDSNGDVIVLVDAPKGKTVDDPQLAATVNAAMDRLKTEHPQQIESISSYFEQPSPQLASPDRDRAFIAIGLQGDGSHVLRNYRAIENDLNIPGVDTQIAGATAIAGALDEGMTDDISRAELYGLPAVGILLLVVFGGLLAAFMPLIVGILSILGSLGILAVMTYFTQVNTFAQSVVTLLGLGLAIDYGLFMVSRFREELSEGVDVPQAVSNTTATAGKTVVASALMVAVAISGLFIFPQAFLKSVAYGAISAVGLAAILSLTVLPSIFGLLGHRINALSIRRGAASRSASHMNQSIWGRIPAWAMRHSAAVTIVICAGLLALTAPLVGVKFGGINETYLPPGNDTRQAQEAFDTTFPQLRTDPVKIVVTGANSQQLIGIYRQANAVEGLTGRFAPTHPTQDGTTVLAAGIKDRADYPSVVEALHNLDTPDGVTVEVGGTPALEQDSIHALFDKLPWMLLYITIATFILMALVFGSLILPAKAVIMTLLGMGATLGILTAIFIDGVGASFLNFTPGPLMSPVLVLIMAIIYGLSTDYEVFLLSRMVEARERGASTKQAIRFGTATTGGIITAAAIIMIVVCSAFGFSTIVMMKYIAFGMIAALILDATIIRMLLVPAVMYLLRDDCWWAPRWVKRASAFLGHGATLTPAGSASAAGVGGIGGVANAADAADSTDATGSASVISTSAGGVSTDAEPGSAEAASSEAATTEAATAESDSRTPKDEADSTQMEPHTDESVAPGTKRDAESNSRRQPEEIGAATITVEPLPASKAASAPESTTESEPESTTAQHQPDNAGAIPFSELMHQLQQRNHEKHDH